jgi:N-acetylmuramoyl-L-alanine amidase
MNRRRLTPRPPAFDAVEPAVISADIELFARTLWGEAGGESVRGIEALAAVVMNRAAVPPGRSIDEACRGFPCWNPENPDRPRMLGLKAGAGPAGDLLFTTCLRIARRAVAGLLDDPTGGATLYHDRSTLPDWTSGRVPTAEIGNRLFYTGTGPSPGANNSPVSP